MMECSGLDPPTRVRKAENSEKRKDVERNWARPAVPLYRLGTRKSESLPEIELQTIRISGAVGDSKEFAFSEPYIGIIVWVITNT